MKQIGIFVFTLVLAAVLVIAAGQGPSEVQGAHEPGAGAEVQEQAAGEPAAEGAEVEEEEQVAGEQAVEGAEAEEEEQGLLIAPNPQAVQAQERAQLKEGKYKTEDCEDLEVQAEEGTKMRLRVRDAEAHSELSIISEPVQDRIRLHTNLSNGKGAEIKIMPSTASERALERLRLKVCSPDNNCTIQLKEVGVGNQTRAAYEVQAEKEARVLGLFKTKMRVQAQVDAESGEVIKSKKPWWAFLASEPEQ